MRRGGLILIMSLSVTILLYGQETDFADLKSKMTSKSLPLVNLTYDETKLNTATFIEGKIEIVDLQRRTEGKTNVSYHAKFRIRGASAGGLNKKSFAVKLLDENSKDLDADIFGIRPENSWILDGMGFDRIRMRNRVCFDLWNEMSCTPYPTKYENRNGTKGVFVEVFVNENYHGLYCMTDKIDRKLLGLKKYENNTVRGLLYKGINYNSSYRLKTYDKNADTDKKEWDAWELQYPEDYPSIDTWKPLMDLIDFCSNNTSKDKYNQHYNDYFYTSTFEDYWVMMAALNVGDNLYKNTFLSVVDITEGHRYMITPWDMDMSLGGKSDGTNNESLVDLVKYSNRAPYDRLYFQNIDGFMDRVKEKWRILQNTVFSVEHVHKILDDYGTLFVQSGAWEREYAKWKQDHKTVLQNDLSKELDYVKDWYIKNYDYVCQLWGRQIKGDVNGDNYVKADDVKELKEIIMKKKTDYKMSSADVNADGLVNAADIVEVIKIIRRNKALYK